MSDEDVREEIWAELLVAIPAAEQPAIWVWWVTVAGRRHWYAPELPAGMLATHTERLHRIRVDVQHIVLVDDLGELVQPWLIRCYLEACIAVVGIVGEAAAFTGQELLGEAETMIGVLAAFGAIGSRWGRMAALTTEHPAPAVALWQQWTAVAEWGALDSMAEMVALLPGPLPAPRQGDAVPEGWAAQLEACYRIFEDLHAHLKPDRIPAVVRRPAAAYGGLSMLQMIQAGRTQELAEDVRTSFDWGSGS